MPKETDYINYRPTEEEVVAKDVVCQKIEIKILHAIENATNGVTKINKAQRKVDRLEETLRILNDRV